MEPQLEGCGKRHPLCGDLSGWHASMEPQLEGCGKAARPLASAGWTGFNGAAT